MFPTKKIEIKKERERENLPTMGFLIDIPEIEGHWSKINELLTTVFCSLRVIIASGYNSIFDLKTKDNHKFKSHSFTPCKFGQH